MNSGGSAFTLELPLTGRGVTATVSMTRMLVVEDEPTIAMGLQDDLRLEGFDVDVAGGY